MQNEPYCKFYGSQKYFYGFPVVNIFYDAAKLYCMWLTSKSGNKNLEFGLSTRAEWTYAAIGGKDSRAYAWDGIMLQNKKGESKCNYRAIGDECI